MTQATVPLMQLVNEETNSQVVKSTKKTKVTIYLTEEAEHAFTELYIARYRKNQEDRPFNHRL